MLPAISAPSSADELLARLRAAHRCPPGCPGCAAEEAEAGIPDPLHDWETFVASEAALRTARDCRRSGEPFPQLSPDPVTQFCIREAVFERLALLEAQASAGPQPGDGDKMPPGRLSDPGYAAALEKARAFARTGRRT